jgi:hypothetical protein
MNFLKKAHGEKDCYMMSNTNLTEFYNFSLYLFDMCNTN